MAGRVETIETIVTQTEVEALHLEQNLVKRHRPPFNVRLRDDKSFPYIAVTVEDDYPRVMFTRERHRRGVVYFGPYANAKKVRETLDVLNRVFRYRPCEGPQPGRHSGIPCLDFHIERCHAPCVGYISKEDYRELIERVIEFLSGDDRPIQRALERQMQEAAADERFEDAARYRNRLRAVERLAERQAVERQVDRDDRRDRRRRRRPSARPCRSSRSATGGWSTATRSTSRTPPARTSPRCSSSSASSTTAAAPSIPPQILVPRGLGDTSALAAFLSELRGSRVEVRAPERGEKRRLQELAQQNAELALESETFVAETKRLRRVEALEELREALNLESLPIRIECFDISNIQGQEIVGSMVVFEDGVAKKAHYRKFGVRGAGRARTTSRRWREVVSRRFARLAADAGGRGLGRVVRRDAEPRRDRRRQGPARRRRSRRCRRYDLPRVAVIALAKRIEEVFVPGPAGPDRARRALAGPAAAAADPRRGAPLRDHASTASAATRRARESMFDQLEGVGPVRRRALLQHFGSAERVLAAIAGGARRRARRAGEDGARDLRAAPPRRRRLGFRAFGGSEPKATQSEPRSDPDFQPKGDRMSVLTEFKAFSHERKPDRVGGRIRDGRGVRLRPHQLVRRQPRDADHRGDLSESSNFDDLTLPTIHNSVFLALRGVHHLADHVRGSIARGGVLLHRQARCR